MWTSKPPFSSICSFLDGGFIRKERKKKKQTKKTNATQTVKLPSNNTQGSMKIFNWTGTQTLGQEEPTPPKQKKKKKSGNSIL